MIHSKESPKEENEKILIYRLLYERCAIIAAAQTLQLDQSSPSASPSSISALHILPLVRSSLRLLDLSLMVGSDESQFHKLIHQLVPQLEDRLEKHRVIEETENNENDTEQECRIKRRRLHSPSNSVPSSLSPSLPTSSSARPIDRIEFPSLISFHQTYLLPSRPCIITGAISSWPALERWQDLSYFLRIGRYRTVPVEVGGSYDEEDWKQELWSIQKFVNEVRLREESQTTTSSSSSSSSSSDSAPSPSSLPSHQSPSDSGIPTIYLAQHSIFTQIPALAHDILQPDYCLLARSSSTSSSAGSSLDDSSSDSPSMRIWLGPRDTVSPLHYDPTDGLLAQVKGRKYIRLYQTSDVHIMKPLPAPLANTSSYKIHLTVSDSSRLPDPSHLVPSHLPYTESILQPGEMLFIPRGVWHYIRSLDASASVSFWFN